MIDPNFLATSGYSFWHVVNTRSTLGLDVRTLKFLGRNETKRLSDLLRTAVDRIMRSDV